MSELNSELLLEKYESLMVVVEDLQEKLATLSDYYVKVRDKYDLYDGDVERALAEIPKLTSKSTEAITQKSSEATSEIAASVKEAKAVLKDLKKATTALSTLIEQANNTSIEVPELEERIAALEERIEQGVLPSNFIEFDYDEELTGAEIWEKYNGRTAIPIIVKMSSWTGDYCYVITNYDEDDNKVEGRIYKDGELYTQGRSPNGTRRFSGSTQFYIYQSPNEDSIVENELQYDD